MTRKALTTELMLLDSINVALRNEWKHKNHHCLVGAIKKADLPGRNWDVDITQVGGADLKLSEECAQLLERVLSELIPKYDVHWTR